ncbi:diGeorge syndrome critical region 6 (DGCR6) protein [Ditylenchus destructor]|nr:diGeorge syndrome critical region 6 (DGCR6) protein [Ditylenchus destructor]
MDGRRNQIKNLLIFFLEGEDPQIRLKLENDDIMNRIVDCLLDGTVYSIVESLKDLQRLRESEIVQDRARQLSAVRTTDDEEIRRKTEEIDKGIAETIDEIAKEQQATLCCSGIPMFMVTTDTEEIKLQMSIINFILSLSTVYTNHV